MGQGEAEDALLAAKMTTEAAETVAQQSVAAAHVGGSEANRGSTEIATDEAATQATRLQEAVDQLAAA